MQPGAESLRRSPAGVASPLPLSCEDRVLAPSLSRKKMKLSRQFTVFGSAIFCVVIFSLYLMLDRGHLDYPRGPRREGSFPQVSTWCRARGRRASLGVLTSSRRCSAPGQGEATPDGPAEPAPAQAVPRSDPPSSQSAGRRSVAAWRLPEVALIGLRTRACGSGFGHLLTGNRRLHEYLCGSPPRLAQD